MDILLVEDDVLVSDLLERVLLEAGHTVMVCGTIGEAESALSSSRGSSFDIVVLDWMLPDGDGLDLCSRLHRRQPPLPVLMLTARGEVHDRVLGLRTGADDYLAKPFEVDELLARLDVVHRRTNRSWVTQLGPLEIDRRDRTVRAYGGKRFDLTSREYALLACLAECPDECVPRQTLFANVWNMSFDPGSGVIDVQVSRLRDKLGDFAWMVETVRGMGFRLRTSSAER
jgi:DNA-binding response OmpR family regulator